MEAWGGSFKLESRAGLGTSVILALPKSDLPSWYIPPAPLNPVPLSVPERHSSEKTDAVLIDDDEFVRMSWVESGRRVASESAVFQAWETFSRK